MKRQPMRCALRQITHISIVLGTSSASFDFGGLEINCRAVERFAKPRYGSKCIEAPLSVVTSKALRLLILENAGEGGAKPVEDDRSAMVTMIPGAMPPLQFSFTPSAFATSDG
jgi:hypothetical protein